MMLYVFVIKPVYGQIKIAGFCRVLYEICVGLFRNSVVFGVRGGLFIIHEHREKQIKIALVTVAVVVSFNTLVLRWTHTTSCWSVSTVVHAQEE